MFSKAIQKKKKAQNDVFNNKNHQYFDKWAPKEKRVGP